MGGGYQWLDGGESGFSCLGGQASMGDKGLMGVAHSGRAHQ